MQVGCHGRTVSEIATDLGCDWHTVMDAVMLYGEPLIDDPSRLGTVAAVGLDETRFVRLGPFRRQAWSTQIVDVAAGQLLDVVAGRDSTEPCAWFAARPAEWWLPGSAVFLVGRHAQSLAPCQWISGSGRGGDGGGAAGQPT